MKRNKDYKNAALAALKGNWSESVLTTLLFVLIAGFLSGGVTSVFVLANMGATLGIASSAWDIIITFFLIGPLAFGFYNSFKRLYINSDGEILRNTFTLGFTNYLHIVGGYALMYIYLFLWSLLLVIPGIVKYCAYAMTPFILVDNPELSVDQAIHRSRELMAGRKMDFFLLSLSFIGWGFLCVITLGIGTFWVGPYLYTTYAAFYEDVKADWEAGHFAYSSKAEKTVIDDAAAENDNTTID